MFVCVNYCCAGNLSAAAAFAVAFLGDVLDVAAHIVVVTGLLHTHFQVRFLRCRVEGGGAKRGRPPGGLEAHIYPL